MSNKKHVLMRLCMCCAWTLAATLLYSGCKGQQEMASQWTGKSIEVDGDMNDWVGLTTTYFEDRAVQLGLSNDSDRLYILFRFNNEVYARQISMGGLTLWLDNSGRKNHNFGIRYSGGPSPAEFHGQDMTDKGGFEGRLTDEQKERLRRRADAVPQITILNGEGLEQASLPVDGSRGPAVAFADSKGMYTYEFSVPLQKTDVMRYGVGAQTGQAISFGLQWGLSDEERKEMMEDMGGPPGGGMGGGPPGGGMGGGPRGGGRPQMPGKQEVWVKTTLAIPPQGQE